MLSAFRNPPPPEQDGRTQGFIEPAERVTQALSVSRVTWKEHLSLEQMGESESPTPFAPIKHHPWHRSHSLCRKNSSYPHLPTMTGPFKEPLKLVKGGSAQQMNTRAGHPTSDPAAPGDVGEAPRASHSLAQPRCFPITTGDLDGLRGRNWGKGALRPLRSGMWEWGSPQGPSTVHAPGSPLT